MTRNLQTCHQNAIRYLTEVASLPCPVFTICNVTQDEAATTGRCTVKCKCESNNCVIKLVKYPAFIGNEWEICYISGFHHKEIDN